MVHIVPITATGLFLLGRLGAFQHFRPTRGLLPEHRIPNLRLRVRSHLILRSFPDLAPVKDLEGAIRMAPAADLEGAVTVVQAADSAAEAIRVAVDAWEEPAAADTAAAADNSHVCPDFPYNNAVTLPHPPGGGS